VNEVIWKQTVGAKTFLLRKILRLNNVGINWRSRKVA